MLGGFFYNLFKKYNFKNGYKSLSLKFIFINDLHSPL
jgi:hypothetical protein